MSQTPTWGPFEWLLGLLGTITLGWVGATSKKVNEHETKIAVLCTEIEVFKSGQREMLGALGRIEERLDSKDGRQ